MKQITPVELKHKLDAQDGLVVLDVREQWEYENCAIDGSINISLSEITSKLDRLDKSAEIVVMCHHGMRSQQAADFLEQQGFEKISNLQGGIDAWSLEVDPNVPRY